ncbi:MAG: hypothetical protein IPK32_26370 [Verrucomicrobiaceae bacterium]|nr:hypothetical protein [Verrucomicrobiaceae bacterium]
MTWAGSISRASTGNQEAQTPNIDRIAAEGIRFEQFHGELAHLLALTLGTRATRQYPPGGGVHSYHEQSCGRARRGGGRTARPQRLPHWPVCSRATLTRRGHFGESNCLGGQRDVPYAPPLPAYGFGRSLTNFEGIGAKLLPLARSNPAMPNRGKSGAMR